MFAVRGKSQCFLGAAPWSLFQALLCTGLSDITHQDKIDTVKGIRPTIVRVLSIGVAKQFCYE